MERIIAAIYLPHLFAYVNPGTGLLMLQLILAGLAGVAFRLKRFRDRVFQLFRFGRDPIQSEKHPETKSSD